MREVRKFAERTRTRTTDEVRKKYFLVFEGSNTEPIYFEAVHNAQTKLNISPLIEIIPLERSRDEKGWSNPKKILERLSLNLEEIEQKKFSYSTLLNAILDCLFVSNYIQKRGKIIKEVWDSLRDQCGKKRGNDLGTLVENFESAVEMILEVIKESKPRIYELIITNLENSLETSQLTYDSEIDTICFIYDRDKKSFTKDQYKFVIETCNSKNIKPYPSNPCFEFWLLLHFNEVNDFDHGQLLENNKISKSKNAETFTVDKFQKIMYQYTGQKITKSKYPTDILIERIPLAIQNEKQFCEDPEKLENQLGSSVGLLLSEIISSK